MKPSAVISPDRQDNGAAAAVFNGPGPAPRPGPPGSASGFSLVLPRLAADARILHPPPHPRPPGQPAPFVVDDGLMRSLHFSPWFVQSEMSLDAPYDLKLAYTRQMMAFLLFLPRPRHLSIVGLGGGSLTKFCHRELPRTRVTTVEIDQGVIDCAPYFEMPAEDQRLRLVHADAVAYFAAAPEPSDVILVDGCDESGTVSAFCRASFYRDLRAALQPGGVLVVNLIGLDAVVEAHQRLIEEAFEGRALLQEVPAEGNRIAFAFQPPRSAPDWPAIEREARKLARKHGLDFPAFARRMRRTAPPIW